MGASDATTDTNKLYARKSHVVILISVSHSLTLVVGWFVHTKYRQLYFNDASM